MEEGDGVNFRIKEVGLESFSLRLRRRLWEVGEERMSPGKIRMRQRPLEGRSSWRCQGRASDWLRTLKEGIRIPMVMLVAREGLLCASS